MYLTHGSRAGSVEGFADRDGRRGARGTEDHREVRGIGDSSESLVGSDPGDIAGKQQPRTCRADAAPHDGRRPGRGQEGAGCQRRFPVITARSMDCASEPGVIVAGAGALPRARRRCEAGKRTHGPGTRACLALLAATALLALAAPAQAQTEMVPADWALKPADLGAGEQFRLIFVSSTGRDALSTDIADYNTFVSTRAAAGVTAMRTYADDFKALVSTASVNARANTLTRATDTDVPIYWVRTGTVPAGSRVADDYADLYDGTWKTGAGGYDESGGTVGIDSDRFWTGMNTDGTTHATLFMGASGNVYTWRVTSSAVRTASLDHSGTYRIAALSPVFQVAGGTPNTAPTAANKTVTTGEDRAYAFTADDFGFDDDDAGATLASVTIVTPPALGTLALDGTAVMADDVVTKAQIDGDMLTFTPAQDAHADAYTTFTFTVNDGTDDSASAYTMTIDVTDAPAPVCAVPSFGDRREIWTGTVTVERGESSGTVYYGFIEGVEGTLLPSQSFSIGSNNYVIDAILVGVNGTMEFSIGGFSSMTSKEGGALRLHVCDGDYDFITSFSSENTTTWLATTLDWSPPVVTRTVYLSLPANNPATGEPAITGTAQAGQELTADASPIMDADGLPSSFTYQWVRVDADGTSNPVDITDATAATYTLTAADAGKKIKVQVSFTDELSGEEERTSAAYPSSGTVTTAASTTAPALLSVTVTSTPRKTTDTYGAREHIEFSMTFDAPVTVTGAPTFAFDLGGATTATWYAGSGTATLRFSHAVTGGSSGDRGHERDFLGRERDRAQRRHHRGDRQRGGGGPDPRRPVEPGGAQGRRPDDGRHARHGHRGGDLDADVDGVGLVHGGHLRFRRDDRDHGHRQRGGGGGGRSRVPILADQPRQCRQQPAGHLRSHAQHRDDDGIHLHGAGGRPGQQRHLDRHPQPNLQPGRERPHPHGLAADRHRPQPSREGHAGRPQGGRIPGGADRTAGSHGADPGVGHRHDAHHRVDAPG